ncbi:transcriptional repressor TraM [Pinisolibacter sp.]|uniref:transcriptional repressor TraM n=1 Tax=Pinisolibacter sp. TaxID=2172024 RepID=UPI002FDF0159
MQRFGNLPTASADVGWRERIERLSAADLERATCDALDENRRQIADDQAIYEAWRHAERVLSEAEVKARDLRDEYQRRQAAAKIAQEQLAFLIDRLGFIPGSTDGLMNPKKRIPSGRSHGGRRRPAARSTAL